MSPYEKRVQRLREHVLGNQQKPEHTAAELKGLLEEKGIEFDPKAKKGELLKLLEGGEAGSGGE